MCVCGGGGSTVTKTIKDHSLAQLVIFLYIFSFLLFSFVRSWLPFDSPFLSPLLFFGLVLLPFCLVIFLLMVRRDHAPNFFEQNILLLLLLLFVKG